MAEKMCYCHVCGEYLGDYVGGVLYRFGQVVDLRLHVCDKACGGDEKSLPPGD